MFIVSKHTLEQLKACLVKANLRCSAVVPPVLQCWRTGVCLNACGYNCFAVVTIIVISKLFAYFVGITVACQKKRLFCRIIAFELPLVVTSTNYTSPVSCVTTLVHVYLIEDQSQTFIPFGFWWLAVCQNRGRKSENIYHMNVVRNTATCATNCRHCFRNVRKKRGRPGTMV